jgi:hypothetical protein
MIGNYPIFKGDTDIHQISQIIQLLGTPTPANWPVISFQMKLMTEGYPKASELRIFVV